MSEIILTLAGGLGIFILSIHKLSAALQDSFFDKARYYISKSSNNIFLGVITGFVATAILGSSSATIIITIILVNAKKLTFRESLGIVLGSNIGTTMSSQIIAMDVAQYAAIPLIVGMVVHLLAKAEDTKKVGEIVMFLGLLFFGLFIIETSLDPLKETINIKEQLLAFNNPFKGALLGGVFTLIIQSSSATVGLMITMAKQGLVSASSGIAVMLGAELGTCSDTLIAVMGGNRQAVRTGLFHLLFNIVTVIVGLLLFGPFVHLVNAISINHDPNNLIANAHFLFNAMGTILFFPLIPWIETLLNRAVPDKKDKSAR